MKQLTLDVRPAPEPTFDNFVAGANAELLLRLHGLSRASAGESIYLWGSSGSGRSHLLQAAVAAYAKEAKAVYIRASEAREDLPAEEGMLFAIDDVEGSWIPYGGGPRMCPGRHFAKREIILTTAMLVTMFDCEVLRDVRSLKMDMRGFGFGTLNAVGKVPVRMRRRNVHDI